MTRQDRTFSVTPFVNPSGQTVYRVTGWEGAKRVRENYRDKRAAAARRNELESTWLAGSAPALREVDFPVEFQKACSAAFLINPDPKALLDAVRYWANPSRPQMQDNAPKLDDAAQQYLAWMDTPSCLLRTPTKAVYRSRIKMFVGKAGCVELATLTPDRIGLILDEGWPIPATRGQVRGVICAFFSWCASAPRRWITFNPALAKMVVIRIPTAGVPRILTPRQVLKMLAAARRYRDGMFLPFVVRQLFAGMRPTEAVRMKWSAFNEADAEIHLDASETKTERPRTIHLDPVAVAWIKAAGKMVFNPLTRPDQWRECRKLAGLSPWTKDVLRHTAISYKFRSTGSYGLTAEWAGNSEAIIKKHYQGQVSSAEAATYWGLHPDRKIRRASKGAV